jgi:pyridoxal phosphate enzyme (YggS family)
VKVDTIAARVEDVMRRVAAACRRSGRSEDEVTLVAVTKSVPPQAILEAAGSGLRDFGENRVQEAAAKRPALEELPQGIRWHMVGHLQTNKVKECLRLFDIIHSVDSLHLAEAVSRRAARPVPVFLEVNVAGESTKYGFRPYELHGAFERIRSLPNLEVRGLMTVAPLTSDAEEVRPVFAALRVLAERLNLSGLSMGMSDDFEVAVEEGATHIRVGRAIFGERPGP